MPKQFLDTEAFKQFLAEGVKHYEQNAPRLSNWLDEMYMRLGEEDWKTITLEEIQQIQYLYADGCWLNAANAQNNIYRLLNRMGKDTKAIAGF